MDFASSTRAAENSQDGKGLLQIHLWCPDDLPRLWDRIEIDRAGCPKYCWHNKVIT